MSENKNQHFVPRCHLSHFSHLDEGKAINVYNISNGKLIKNASIKGQCARDFFYGHDLKVEKYLQGIEGRYASVVRSIENDQLLNVEDIYVLKAFALLQYLRTEQALKIQAEEHASMISAVNSGPAPITNLHGFTQQELVNTMIWIFNTSLYVIDDLKGCILDNRGHGEFVTSDDPVIFTNKFNQQKLRQDSFGLSSSGVIFFLPLTPRFCFLMYDPNIYYVGSINHCLFVKKSHVEVLNECQYIRAHENIYFKDWSIGSHIKESITYARKHRPEKWGNTKVLIKDTIYNSEEATRYKEATPEEIKNSMETLIMSSPIHFYPLHWPNFIKYRMAPKAMTNGSSIGCVRPAIAWRKNMGLDEC